VEETDFAGGRPVVRGGGSVGGETGVGKGDGGGGSWMTRETSVWDRLALRRMAEARVDLIPFFCGGGAARGMCGWDGVVGEEGARDANERWGRRVPCEDEEEAEDGGGAMSDGSDGLERAHHDRADGVEVAIQALSSSRGGAEFRCQSASASLPSLPGPVTVGRAQRRRDQRCRRRALGRGTERGGIELVEADVEQGSSDGDEGGERAEHKQVSASSASASANAKGRETPEDDSRLIAKAAKALLRTRARYPADLTYPRVSPPLRNRAGPAGPHISFPHFGAETCSENKSKSGQN
jgi:hypothetical protein